MRLSSALDKTRGKGNVDVHVFEKETREIQTKVVGQIGFGWQS